MVTSLIINAGMGLLTSAAISSSAVKMETVVAEKKAEKVAQVAAKAAEQAPVPVSVPAKVKLKKDKHGMPTYPDTQRRRIVRATAYSHMENEPGAHGRKNAIGTRLSYKKSYRSAAADWSVYPVGTKFKIKGDSSTYIIDDYGSALAGTNTVDLYKPTLRGMRKWGLRKVEIKVIEWGSYERSRKILSARRGYWHCRQMYDAIEKKLESGKYAQLENVIAR